MLSFFFILTLPRVLMLLMPLQDAILNALATFGGKEVPERS